MHTVLFFVLLLWMSFCFAQVEIAIEGGHGWAEKLPTWKWTAPSKNWASLLFFSGRPLTGYHLWTEIFILSMMHIPYLYTEPSYYLEAQILAFFCFFCVFEDFLWFVLNPAFGLKKFRKKYIWWHAYNWWWIAPRDYYVLTFLGTVFYLLSMSHITLSSIF
jgi:hypothetical protein